MTEKKKYLVERKVSDLGLRQFVKKREVNNDPYFVYCRSVDGDRYYGLHDNMTKDDAIVAAAGLFALHSITKEDIDAKLKELIHGKEE